MKTPIREAIANIKEYRDMETSDVDTCNIILLYLSSLLDKEKEVLMRSYQDGLDNGFANGNWDLNLWYNETFKTK